MKTGIITLLLLTLLHPAQSQDSLDIAGYFWMDSVVITATQSGFDVDEFIRLVREDSSFHQAFRNIRTLSYKADNHIQFKNKQGRETASHKSTTRQSSDGVCRSMEFLQ